MEQTDAYFLTKVTERRFALAIHPANEFQYEVDDQCNEYLRFYCIFAGSHKRFNLKVLLHQFTTVHPLLL